MEKYAENTEEQNLVDLAMDKKPLEFASEFHERMLGRIKEMLDPYREQIAHDLMKNEIEEVEEDDTQNEDKVYKDMYKERKKFFDKKTKGMPKPFDKSHGLKSSRVEEVENDEEQLDELSGKLLKRYVTAANKDSNARAEKMKHMSKDEIMKTRPAKKVWARDKNIQLAKSKRGIRNNRLN